ncbi:MAG: hypothetical protein E7L36_00520 [Prevotella bivia]|nr:hypothetical protein [Prevotella bivia]
MKLKNLFGMIAFSAILLTSCSTTTIVPGFEKTIFIDYSLFRSNGIEVSDANVPDGCTSIGQLSEIVRFSRIYESKTVAIPRNSNDDIIVPMSKTIITSNGDFDSDIISMAEKISTIVKERNGKGIAKLNVSVTDTQEQPVFFITGIVYK